RPTLRLCPQVERRHIEGASQRIRTGAGQALGGRGVEQRRAVSLEQREHVPRRPVAERWHRGRLADTGTAVRVAHLDEDALAVVEGAVSRLEAVTHLQAEGPPAQADEARGHTETPTASRMPKRRWSRAVDRSAWFRAGPSVLANTAPTGTN